VIAAILAASAKFCFGVAGFSFLVGGGLIHAIANVDRMTAEAEGMGLTAVFAVLGIFLGATGKHFDDDESI
jgi:hypothetical protein